MHDEAFSDQIRASDQHLIQITDAAFADAARRSGDHLVCHPGCTQCCHGTFAISALDAVRLRYGMEQLTASEPARAEQIRARADLFWKEYAPAYPGNLVTGILGQSEAEQEVFEDFANEAACPALDPATGLCDLYEYRPMTCRIFGPPVRMGAQDSDQVDVEEEALGLAICELCFTEATEEEILAAEMQAPHAEEDDLLNQLPNAEEQTIIAHVIW
jgi:Fe-S-cluster containining protein